VAFDDDRLVADAGLLLPATLAHHLGLKELVDEHLDLGARPGRANVGHKLLTLVMSARDGGDCIDDANALRAGSTERVLGFSVKAASTLGTFLRSFRWGHVRQLDRVSRELLARAWAAGVPVVEGALLGQTVRLADRRVEIDRERLGSGSRSGPSWWKPTTAATPRSRTRSGT
jgi:hypothetical protein